MSTKKVLKNKVAKKAPKKALKKAVKTVTKTAAKKIVKKNTITKKPTRATKKSLTIASNEQSFWVIDGSVLNSLVALRDALSTMEKKVYAYHTISEHNDFVEWVSSVLDD